MRSIRSFSRARTDGQRGYVLVAAIVLAVLFFGLIQLLLIDSQRELSEARRFKARVMAQVLAENGAELAALGMVERAATEGRAEDAQGTMEGKYNGIVQMGADGVELTRFVITARGKTKGPVQQEANVMLEGEFDKDRRIKINWSRHSQ